MSKLDLLRNEIVDDYTRGQITKDQYEKLVEETSIKYREIFKNELYSLDMLSLSEREIKLSELKNNIEDSFAAGKVNELQYSLLKEKLSKYEKR